MRGAGLSIILYLSHVASHFDTGQGTSIGDNRICQASHMIECQSLSDSNKKTLQAIGFKGEQLLVGGLGYSRECMTTVANRRSSTYGDETAIMQKIIEIRTHEPWFNNRSWVVDKSKYLRMVDCQINMGADEVYKRAKHVNKLTGKTCSCNYCVSTRSHPMSFRGPYIAMKAGESREYGHFSSIMDSTFSFAYNYMPTYKQMLQFAVGIVDEFNGTMLFQDIMQYSWNNGNATRKRNLKSSFDDPRTNAQEMLCAEIADHESSNYPHVKWRGQCSLNRTSPSGDISCEGNDVLDKDLDLFAEVSISIDEVDGKDSRKFNRNKYYMSIHRELKKLNETATKPNGNIVKSAEEAIAHFRQLNRIGTFKSILLIQVFSRLGLINPVYALYGTVGSKELGPYKFINTYHCSHDNVQESETPQDISLDEAKRCFEVIFKHLHILDKSFERDDLDGTTCEGYRNVKRKWKHDIYYLSDDGELQNVYKVVRNTERKASIMLYIGGHRGTQKWVPMTDVFDLFYSMKNLTNDSRMSVLFKKGADPMKVEKWIRNICYDGKKDLYHYPTSGRFFTINDEGKDV
eukprot:scaffold158077_cov29-Attheya_sp.AAC.1